MRPSEAPEIPYPTEDEMNRAFWEAIQGHGSPADRIALEALTEFPRTPSVPYIPDAVTENPDE